MKKPIFAIFFVFLLSISAFSQTFKDWKWRVRINGFSGSAYNKSTVFLADENGNVLALDKNTGRQIWKLPLGKDVRPDLVLQGDNLVAIVTEVRKQAHLIDIKTGKEIKRFVSDSSYTYPRLDAQGNLLIKTNKGLTAYDVQSGKEKWVASVCQYFCEINSSENYTVVSEDGLVTVYFSDTGKEFSSIKRHGKFSYLGETSDAFYFKFQGWEQQTIYSINKKTGETNNSIKFANPDDFLSEIFDNNLYLTFFNSPRALVFDLAAKKVNWEFELEDSETRFSSPVADGKSLYLGNSDGWLFVFDKSSGKLFWKKKYGNEAVESPLIVDGFGYLTTQNKIFKINLKTGIVLWEFSAYGGITILEHNEGKLYFESLDKSFNAIEIKNLDRLAKKKRQFGATKISRDADIDVDRAIGVSSGNGATLQSKLISEPFTIGNKAYFTITNQIEKQGSLNELDLSNGDQRIIAGIKGVNLTKPFIYKGSAYLNDLPNRGYNEINASLISVELESGKVNYLKTAASFSKTPKVYNDVIYVAGSNEQIYSFDLQGKKVENFRSDTGFSIHDFIEFDNDTIFFRNDKNTFSALSDKEVLWKFTNPNSIMAFSRPFDDSILVSGSTENIYKLNNKTGEEIWRKDYSDDLVYNIQTNRNKGFILSEAAFTYWLQAISLEDGKTIWDKNLFRSSGVPIISGDNICLDNTESFECYSQASGEITSSYSSQDYFYSFSQNGILLYFVKDKADEKTSELKAIDLKTGKEIWRKVL
jgi:outer membrane protein assembly factor BamB